ncbi:hypothetical protein STHU_39910 [Allostella humosa]|uniref:hypothetical protein n=1 Tax=Stella humosa TaxID=94 RepID=UPI00113E6471|nr:hypothetical protein [Stella humosa]BBK33357.1 hypothetical protein STHU_39910 [Stella humosa]
MTVAARLGGLAAAVLMALALPAAGQSTPAADALTRLLGPLAPQGVIGRAGDWEMAIVDDAYVLANRSSPYGARFVSIAAPAGPLALAAEVRSEPGNAAADALVGAGLLFDVQGAGAARRFSMVLVERTGEIGLFRGDQSGLNKVETRKLPGATGFIRLAVAEEAGKLAITANGIRVATAPLAPTAGTRAGLVAVGPGRFAFRAVRVGLDPATVAATPQRFGRVEARLPADWNATLSDVGAWTARGPGDARVVWWPLHRTGAMSDADRAELLDQAIAAHATGLAAGPAEQRAGGLSRPLLRDGRPVGRAWLSAVPAGDGASAALFALATDMPGDGRSIAGLLASIRLEGAPPRPGRPHPAPIAGPIPRAASRQRCRKAGR